jgi:flagellar biosynthesis/type III secretory pathway protein FliH
MGLRQLWVRFKTKHKIYSYRDVEEVYKQGVNNGFEQGKEEGVRQASKILSAIAEERINALIGKRQITN